MIVQNENKVFDVSFGQWINALFFNITASDETGPWNAHLDFEGQKEAFFHLLQKWLAEKKIHLLPPTEYVIWNCPEEEKSFLFSVRGEPQYGSFSVPTKKIKGYTIWSIPHEEMILYIRDHWPKDVTDENDLKLIDFFYGSYCPNIIWVDSENGNLVAS